MSIFERDAESSHIDYQSVKKSPAGSFAQAAANIQWLGYGFALVLLILLALNNWYLTIDDKILAVEDGRIVGTINYHNEQVRSYEEIRRDLKSFFGYFYSMNSATIANDRTIALYSMCEQKVNEYLEAWGGVPDEKQGKKNVSLLEMMASAGLTSRMTFEFEHRKKKPIPAVEILDLRGTAFKALIRGDLVVTQPNGQMSEERVTVNVSGELINRSRKNSLGLKICEIRAVEEAS